MLSLRTLSLGHSTHGSYNQKQKFFKRSQVSSFSNREPGRILLSGAVAFRYIYCGTVCSNSDFLGSNCLLRSLCSWTHLPFLFQLLSDCQWRLYLTRFPLANSYIAGLYYQWWWRKNVYLNSPEYPIYTLSERISLVHCSFITSDTELSKRDSGAPFRLDFQGLHIGDIKYPSALQRKAGSSHRMYNRDLTRMFACRVHIQSACTHQILSFGLTDIGHIWFHTPSRSGDPFQRILSHGSLGFARRQMLLGSGASNNGCNRNTRCI